MPHKSAARPLLLTIATALLFLISGCGNDSDQASGPAAANLAKAKAFMAENASKPGIIAMENGIQYRIIKEVEEARMPKLIDHVKIHYVAKHIDGTVYYDTHKDAAPAEVEVKYALLGWRKILPMMTVGSKWEVFLPPHMAYSSKGHENVVQPNEALIFEIELVEIIW